MLFRIKPCRHGNLAKTQFMQCIFLWLKNIGFLIPSKIFVLTLTTGILMIFFFTFIFSWTFVKYMNTKHLHIQFTSEHKHNYSFSFLDVKTCRENNKLNTSVYRKPILRGFFTNFKSYISKVYKFGLPYTLLRRCLIIDSSYQKFHNKRNALKQIFKFHQYSIQFMKRCIKQFPRKLYVAKIIT